jgi:hypothetical protein
VKEEEMKKEENRYGLYPGSINHGHQPTGGTSGGEDGKDETRRY